MSCPCETSPEAPSRCRFFPVRSAVPFNTLKYWSKTLLGTETLLKKYVACVFLKCVHACTRRRWAFRGAGKYAGPAADRELLSGHCRHHAHKLRRQPGQTGHLQCTHTQTDNLSHTHTDTHTHLWWRVKVKFTYSCSECIKEHSGSGRPTKSIDEGGSLSGQPLRKNKKNKFFFVCFFFF